MEKKHVTSHFRFGILFQFQTRKNNENPDTPTPHNQLLFKHRNLKTKLGTRIVLGGILPAQKCWGGYFQLKNAVTLPKFNGWNLKLMVSKFGISKLPGTSRDFFSDSMLNFWGVIQPHSCHSKPSNPPPSSFFGIGFQVLLGVLPLLQDISQWLLRGEVLVSFWVTFVVTFFLVEIF